MTPSPRAPRPRCSDGKRASEGTSEHPRCASSTSSRSQALGARRPPSTSCSRRGPPPCRARPLRLVHGHEPDSRGRADDTSGIAEGRPRSREGVYWRARCAQRRCSPCSSCSLRCARLRATPRLCCASLRPRSPRCAWANGTRDACRRRAHPSSGWPSWALRHKSASRDPQGPRNGLDRSHRRGTLPPRQRRPGAPAARGKLI